MLTAFGYVLYHYIVSHKIYCATYNHRESTMPRDTFRALKALSPTANKHGLDNGGQYIESLLYLEYLLK